eukprot:TRINITY_DN13522_c0_g1_i1.p1 TRINITY_DN13522_c0_g1~~TRINITY_DN13522_c0_g1_i1.p1  ORF type:complete len:482 (-),score=94.55 TRINITY_DN13522_c0_g1_i1:63-1508(-)
MEDVRYGNGSKAVLLLEDHTGTVYYPSGRLAVVISKGSDGLYHQIFDDNPQRTILGSFDYQGVGSVMYPSSHTRLALRADGGCLCDDQDGKTHIGDVLRSWFWSKPLTEAISVPVNKYFKLTIKSQQDILLRFNCQAVDKTFDLGEKRTRGESYLSRSLGTTKTGLNRGKIQVNLEGKHKTLVQREIERVAKPRAVFSVQAKDIEAPDLRKIVTDADTFMEGADAAFHVDPFSVKPPTHQSLQTLHNTLRKSDFRRSLSPDVLNTITTSVKQLTSATTEQLVAEAAKAPARGALIKVSGKYTHLVPKTKPSLRLNLKTLTSATFDKYLADAPRDVLVLVCCFANWISESRRQEQILSLTWGEIEHDRTSAASSTTALPYDIVKFEMAESRMLNDRYGIRGLPMYLAYYGGRLVFASNTFNGRNVDKQNIRAQLQKSVDEARRGKFLPLSFKVDYGKSSLEEGVTKRLEEHFAAMKMRGGHL